MLQAIQSHGLEGIVAKRKGLRYEPGKRSGSWIKYKCGLKQSFLIGGYMPIRSTGVDLGALVVGYRDGDGQLRFAGRVGSGFTAKVSKALLAGFAHLRRTDSPFDELPIVSRSNSWTHGFTRAELATCIWLEPTLACNPVY